MKTNDNVFHLNCFSCVVCGIQLQKGEQYVIKQNQLFCRMDYIKEVEMMQGYPGIISIIIIIPNISATSMLLLANSIQMNKL